VIFPVKNNPEESDGKLLAAIGTGDRRALEGLYLGYHRLSGGGIEACRSSQL
jgi:hypothetical protein